MNIEINEQEKEVLKIILYAEYKTIKDRQEHARSHGDVGYIDTHFKPIANLIGLLKE